MLPFVVGAVATKDGRGARISSAAFAACPCNDEGRPVGAPRSSLPDASVAQPQPVLLPQDEHV